MTSEIVRKFLIYSKVKFNSELDILEQKILFILVFALDEPTEHKKVIREHRFVKILSD